MSGGWRRISGDDSSDVAEWLKFDRDGDEVVGRRVGFGLSAALRDLEEVKIGSLVRVLFRGWAEAKNGRRYRAFQIFIADGASSRGEPQATAEDVPF